MHAHPCIFVQAGLSFPGMVQGTGFPPSAGAHFCTDCSSSMPLLCVLVILSLTHLVECIFAQAVYHPCLRSRALDGGAAECPLAFHTFAYTHLCAGCVCRPHLRSHASVRMPLCDRARICLRASLHSLCMSSMSALPCIGRAAECFFPALFYVLHVRLRASLCRLCVIHARAPMHLCARRFVILTFACMPLCTACVCHPSLRSHAPDSWAAKYPFGFHILACMLICAGCVCHPCMCFYVHVYAGYTVDSRICFCAFIPLSAQAALGPDGLPRRKRGQPKGRARYGAKWRSITAARKNAAAAGVFWLCLLCCAVLCCACVCVRVCVCACPHMLVCVWADVPGDWAQRARLVVRELMASPTAVSFLEPVDDEEVPGYYDIITEPMDLGTIMAKLTRTLSGGGNTYSSLAEVVADVQKVWSNCLEFNEPASEIAADAQASSALFERLAGVGEGAKGGHFEGTV
ncbi:hypothetical protein DUNSADRAFT_17532 [Dunaliella salina]|uniref:Bromo domain-containing protein n=1 Tax=Dunaliella salina TaxID=3046 RepID=A0ABQ7H002_DUNSA|nr:hypothetical protein DUNSADRAFT_17532 [Dunaliella salina]|eukprot:KAF5840185.1 hypothetical protein DUNSADRAFT_17532 [Dunaliella salina]